MQHALSVDMRDGHGRARVTVAGQVSRQSWVTLLRTLGATAAMYSDIHPPDAGDPLLRRVLADLAETGRWLDSHEGRLELVRLTPPPTWGSQPQDSSLAPLRVLRP